MTDKEALQQAKERLDKLDYMLDCYDLNKGLITIYTKEYNWLLRLIGIAATKVWEDEHNDD